MGKRLSKYIACFDYFDKSLIVLSLTTASFYCIICNCHWSTWIISGGFSLAFSISAVIVKKLLKATRNKKKKHNKIVMLARSKLNSIDSKISKALINNEENILNEEKKYRELKKSIRMMNSTRSDVEKISLIKEGKNKY